MTKRHGTIALSFALGGLVSLTAIPTASAKAKPYPDQWFIWMAAPEANEALSREEFDQCKPNKKGPHGEDHPWVDRKDAKLNRRDDTIGEVSWTGKTPEGIEYDVQIRVTVESGHDTIEKLRANLKNVTCQ